MTVWRSKARGGAWWFEFQQDKVRHQGLCKRPDGEPCRNKPEAQEAEFAARKAAKTAAAEQRAVARSSSFALAQAFNLHLRKVSLEASDSHIASLKRIGAEMLAFFGFDRPVVEIHDGDVLDYTEFLKKQKRRVWIGGPRKVREEDHGNPKLWKEADRLRSTSEINHCLDVLRATLQTAHKTRNPANRESLLPSPPEVPELDEPARVPTPMSEAEYRARLVHAPQWTREAAALGWWFGLRLDEIVSLELRHIDWENRCLRLLGAETKSGRDEPAFGGDHGWTLVRWLARQARRRGQVRLITWPGTKWARRKDRPPLDVWRPLKSFRRSWNTSADLAKIDQPRRFHDTRAAYITNIARVGSAPLTQQLARHASMETTKKYIHLVDQEAAQVANLAAKRRSGR